MLSEGLWIVMEHSMRALVRVGWRQSLHGGVAVCAPGLGWGAGMQLGWPMQNGPGMQLSNGSVFSFLWIGESLY